MKKIGRMILYIILGSFILIQFIRVEKNISDDAVPHDFLRTHSDMPENLQQNFRTSCYDCHSNNTNYPWYAHIAPFSWVIDQHIRNGKDELNFNAYDTLGKRQKIAFLDEICEMVSDSSMPPQNYLMLHPDVALSEDEILSICNWTEAEAINLLRK
jgi:hypothetical protein